MVVMPSGVKVENLNDGDLLVLTVPGDLTDTMAESIANGVRKITDLTGKRVGMVLLPEGHTLDHLTSEQVARLYHRLQGQGAST